MGAEGTQRAYQESQLNWTYLAFMTLATALVSIAIVLDSSDCLADLAPDR